MITYFLIGIFFSAIVQIFFIVGYDKSSFIGFLLDLILWPLSILGVVYLIYKGYKK